MKISSFLHFAGFGIKTVLFRKKDPILGTVIVTDKCNLHCKHCSVNNITAIIHPYEQIKSEMQQLFDMGIRILFFCGGETFMWRDGDRTLRDLVKEAKVSVNDGVNYGPGGAGHLRIILGVYKDDQRVVDALNRIASALKKYPSSH